MKKTWNRILVIIVLFNFVTNLIIIYDFVRFEKDTITFENNQIETNKNQRDINMTQSRINDLLYERTKG